MIEERVLVDLSEDRFNRGPIVEQMQHLILSVPRNSGMRIAIFGDWGSGKSSVAELVARQLPEEKWVNVNLAAWSVATVEDFWNMFGIKLVAEVNERRLVQIGKMKSVQAWAAERTNKFKAYVNAAKSDQNFGALFRAGTTPLTLDQTFVGEVISRVAEAGYSISVIVDDLDRMDPKLLPNTLLALREVFADQPVVFIVPIDRGIAVRALETYSEAWRGAGELFIEKIFDYRVSLPDPTFDERLEMVRTILAEIFGKERVPQDFPIEFGASLPPVPRRLKAIGRQLELVRYTIECHYDEEYEVETLILAATMKSESEAFFEAFAREFACRTIEDEALQRPESKMTLEEAKVGLSQISARIFGRDPAEDAAHDSHRRVERIASILLSSRGSGNFSRWTCAIRLLSAQRQLSRKQLDWLAIDTDLKSLSSLKQRLMISSTDLAIGRDLASWAVLQLREAARRSSHHVDGALLVELRRALSFLALVLGNWEIQSATNAIEMRRAELLVVLDAGLTLKNLLERNEFNKIEIIEALNMVERVLAKLAQHSEIDLERVSEIVIGHSYISAERVSQLVRGEDVVFTSLTEFAIEEIFGLFQTPGEFQKLLSPDVPELVRLILCKPESALWRNRGKSSGFEKVLMDTDITIRSNLEFFSRVVLGLRGQSSQMVDLSALGNDEEVRGILELLVT